MDTSARPSQTASGIERLRGIMDTLLSEGGCPWDRAQTLDTLRPYLLEEAHEVLEAMDDPSAHCRELGDLLFQIVFHAALREREGAFAFEDVVAAISDKMVRRHPHVFDPSAPAAATPEAVARQWERIKQAERAADPDTTTTPPAVAALAGIPRALPPLQRAFRLQDKAAALGFDWPDVDGVLDKLGEELGELDGARRAGDPRAIRDELGDVLFVLVRLAQKLGVDAEDALRRANGKFERRFGHVLHRCHELGIEPTTAGLPRLEGFWREAKASE